MSSIRVFRILFALFLLLFLSPAAVLSAQPAVWGRLMEEGKLSLRQGTYEHAKDAFRAAVAKSKELPGDSRVQSLHYLGITHYRLGQYLEAERALKEGLPIAERLWGAENRAVLQLKNHLGTVYVYMGHYTSAEKVFRHVVEIERGRTEPDPENLSGALNNLSQVLMMRRRDKEALAMQREVVAIREAAYGQEHQEVATEMTNLSAQLRMTGMNG